MATAEQCGEEREVRSEERRVKCEERDVRRRGVKRVCVGGNVEITFCCFLVAQWWRRE